MGVGKGGPSALTLLCAPRLTGLEESAWGEEEAAADHNYYNSIPGKEPPLGGLVDSRLAVTQPCALATLGGLGQVSLLRGQKGCGAVTGVGGKWSWDISGPSRLSCRECHQHGEMSVACLGTWAPLEQVGCSSLTESAPCSPMSLPACNCVPQAVCSQLSPVPSEALCVTVPCRLCAPSSPLPLPSSLPPVMRSWQLGIDGLVADHSGVSQNSRCTLEHFVDELLPGMST